MGKGFEEFMKNPFYREQYEKAPTKNLRRYYELSWDSSPFVMGDDYDASKENAELKKITFTKEEVEYLAKYAVGGQQKAFFKKWVESFK